MAYKNARHFFHSFRSCCHDPTVTSDDVVRIVNQNWIHLSWADMSTNEVEFRVEMKLGTGAFSEVLALPADSTTAEIQGLTPSSPYTFRVRAMNSGGFSTYSGEAAASTPADSSIFASPLELTGGFSLPDGWSSVYPGPPS